MAEVLAVAVEEGVDEALFLFAVLEVLFKGFGGFRCLVEEVPDGLDGVLFGLVLALGCFACEGDDALYPCGDGGELCDVEVADFACLGDVGATAKLTGEGLGFLSCGALGKGDHADVVAVLFVEVGGDALVLGFSHGDVLLNGAVEVFDFCEVFGHRFSQLFCCFGPKLRKDHGVVVFYNFSEALLEECFERLLIFFSVFDDAFCCLIDKVMVGFGVRSSVVDGYLVPLAI